MSKNSKSVKRKQATSLWRAFATALMVFSVLSIVVASSIHMALNFQAQSRAIATQQQIIALGAAEKVSNAIDHIFGALDGAGKIGRPLSSSVDERRLLLHSLLELNDDFNEIALLNGLGHELAKVSRYKVYKQSDLVSVATNNLFEQINTNNRYIGPTNIDKLSNEPMITVAVPITNLAGDFSGGLVAKVSLKFVWDLMATLKLGQEGVTYIVDRTGTLIAFHDEQKVLQGENLAHLEQVAAFIHADQAFVPSDAGLVTGITGAYSLAMHAPLGLPDWAVVTEMSVSEAYRPVILSMALSIGVVIIVALLAIAAGLRFARRLVAPMNELAATATRIAEGHLELEAPITGSTEVRGLAAAFNSMTEQLRNFIHSLKKKVSKLEETEGALRESEAYYRSIFENSLYGIAITDTEFKFTKVNEAWCNLIEYTEEELIDNMGISDVTLPDNIPETMEVIGKLISGEVRQGHLEKRYKTKSGKIIDAITFVRGIYDKDDRYLGNAASILNITERKQGERALQKSETKYRRIFESVEDGYILAGMDGTIQSVNPATAKMLKYEIEAELIGKNIAQDIYANTPQREGMLAALMEKGRLKGYLLEFRRRDGEVIAAECNLNLVFDEANLPVAIEGTFRDVTERNRAQQELERHREHLEELVEERTRELADNEQKYEDLYENAPDMFASVDAKTGNVIQCNQTFLKKSHYSKNEVIGKPIFQVYHQDCLDKAKIAFEQFQKTGEIKNEELAIRKKDGSALEVILNVTAIRDEDGKPIYSRSIWVDISVRKEAEKKVLEAKKALEMANKRLQEVDRLKSMFIASMSHEFRTPLNSIMGFTGILLMDIAGKLEPKQRDLIKRANKSSKHLLSLIIDIIDISKIEAGKIEFIGSLFTLDTVIDEAVNEIETIRNEKGLELRVNVPDNVKMDTDRKRVFQCILNLITNAIKYTEKGWVSISASQLNGAVEILVEDSGIGIAEKDLPKLFQPFERLDSPLRTKELGTGLGLYLTKKMVSEILKGSIRVESQVGVGSRFFMTIPSHLQKENIEKKSIFFSLEK